jgi:hypothetical protein
MYGEQYGTQKLKNWMKEKAFKIHENSRKAQHVFWLRAATKMEGAVEGIRNWVTTPK